MTCCRVYKHLQPFEKLTAIVINIILLLLLLSLVLLFFMPSPTLQWLRNKMLSRAENYTSSIEED